MAGMLYFGVIRCDRHPKLDLSQTPFSQSETCRDIFDPPIAGKTISIGYYTLVEFSKVHLKPDILIGRSEWHDADLCY